MHFPLQPTYFARTCLINARSIQKKIDELIAPPRDEDYDIIGVTEPWSNTPIKDYLAKFDVPGSFQ